MNPSREDVEVLFGNTSNAIFNRHDQMKWVENFWGSDYDYNTKKSAFWRVIKGVTKNLYSDPWYSHVAWSNVCKVSPHEGHNPNNDLYHAQLADCKKILETEIKILSPKAVVMLTGKSWSTDFLRYLNGEQGTKSIDKESWDRYECKVYEIAGTIFIRSEHPERKKCPPHIECLTKLLNKYTGMSVFFYIARFTGNHARVPKGYEVRFQSTRHCSNLDELNKVTGNKFSNEITEAAIAQGMQDQCNVTKEEIKGLATEGHFSVGFAEGTHARECPEGFCRGQK